jgi:hypothetical protein
LSAPFSEKISKFRGQPPKCKPGRVCSGFCRRTNKHKSNQIRRFACVCVCANTALVSWSSPPPELLLPSDPTPSRNHPPRARQMVTKKYKRLTGLIKKNRNVFLLKFLHLSCPTPLLQPSGQKYLGGKGGKEFVQVRLVQTIIK